MAITEDSALSGLRQFLATTQSLQSLQRSPEKMPTMDDIMSTVLQQIPAFSYPTPVDSKQAGSSDSETPRNQSPNSDGATDAQTTANGKETRPYRQEPWHECFTTVNQKEFDALIYSLYVMARDDKKMDGHEYYECINRLQSKCRYRVRARRMNEFIIVEERGAHNHAMEPVGTPGTHAGLPKTLREIVDRSFYEDWSNAVRQEKLEEEVRRLGLPHNPRLGRQVDNRIAYLRRVKNLNEMKKIQDQATPMSCNDLFGEGDMKGSLPDATSQGIATSTENPTDLLKIMMQGSQLPELNAETQAQLLSLMMGGVGGTIPVPAENGVGTDSMIPTSSVILPPLSSDPMSFMGNPFLHVSSSLPSLLPLSIDNSINNNQMSEHAEEADGMEDDDACSSENDQQQIDMDQ